MTANRQWPLSVSRYIGSCAADAEQELALGGWPNNRSQLLRATFFPDTAIVTDTTSGFALHLLNKGTSGTANTTIATYTATTAAATLGAYKPISLTFSTATGYTVVDEDEVLTWKETTLGTGTARANGQLHIEHTLF
jgi:hypothetical protein